MRYRLAIFALFVSGTLIIPSINANAFTFGSYCIKLSSSANTFQAPKAGGAEIFRFSFINSCQKTIPSFQVEFAEDISGGNLSNWRTLSEIFTLQDVVPNQQGIVQISFSYEQYLSASNKIYLKSVESESILSGGASHTTNNISVQNVTFATVTTSNSFSSNSAAKKRILAKGSYIETSNDEGAPISASDIIGNIRKIEAIHNSIGALEIVIDFWKVPNSNFATRIKWCTSEDTDFLSASNSYWCNPLSKNDLNFFMTFAPSTANKGTQLGVRKNFKGSVKKGLSSNQLIYTISGSGLISNSVGLIEVQMYYSSNSTIKRTTTCTGVYSITCSSRSSNVFERDWANVKLEQV